MEPRQMIISHGKYRRTFHILFHFVWLEHFYRNSESSNHAHVFRLERVKVVRHHAKRSHDPVVRSLKAEILARPIVQQLNAGYTAANYYQ